MKAKFTSKNDYASGREASIIDIEGGRKEAGREGRIYGIMQDGLSIADKVGGPGGGWLRDEVAAGLDSRRRRTRSRSCRRSGGRQTCRQLAAGSYSSSSSLWHYSSLVVQSPPSLNSALLVAVVNRGRAGGIDWEGGVRDEGTPGGGGGVLRDERPGEVGGLRDPRDRW